MQDWLADVVSDVFDFVMEKEGRVCKTFCCYRLWQMISRDECTWVAIANIKSTWQTPDTIKPPTAVIRFTEHLADVIWPTTDITRQNVPITMVILRLSKYSANVIYPTTHITRQNEPITIVILRLTKNSAALIYILQISPSRKNLLQ